MASPANKPPPSPSISPTPSPAASYSDPGSGLVAVSLSLKRFKLAFAGVLAVAAVAAFVIVFQRGVTLHTVDLKASEANEETQKDLVHKYNSYTGSIASALTKPIESFATMALQLTLLRFAARSLLVPETAWRVDKMVWLSAFVLVYLLLNGFNALNV